MALDLARWSMWRVLLVSFAWLVGLPVAFLCYGFVTMFLPQMNAAGSAGIGAVSVGVSELVVWLWLGAPVVFILTWAILRSRRRT